MKIKFNPQFKFIWITAVLIGLKYLVAQNHWEIFTVGPLLGSLISSDIFLIGFILAGIIPDYKEAERLPAEMVTSITSINDECNIELQKKIVKALDIKRELLELIKLSLNWFEKTAHSETLFDKLSDLNYHFAYIQQDIAPAVVGKIKSEKDNIKKCILRIQEIRVIDFSDLAYKIMEVLSFVTMVILLFLQTANWYESYLYLVVFALLMIYLIDLVRSMDNPFDYYSGRNKKSTISLHPFIMLRDRIEKELHQFNSTIAKKSSRTSKSRKKSSNKPLQSSK